MVNASPNPSRVRACARCGVQVGDAVELWACTESACSRYQRPVCPQCIIRRSALAAMRTEPEPTGILARVPEWVWALLLVVTILAWVSIPVASYFLNWDPYWFRAARWGIAISGALLIVLCWRRVSGVLSETPLGPALGIWCIYDATNPPLTRNTAVRANWDVLRPCCRKCGNLAARVDS